MRPLRHIEIWSEGFAATGEYGRAMKHATIEAPTLREACDKLVAQDPDFAIYYDANNMTYWGCRLFDNEAEAREMFG